jgi:hypothetical protein
VPSAVWAREEYEKLPRYDGEIIEQLNAGAGGLFMCHQRDGRLCAGWLAAHGADNLLALRLHARELEPEVWGYESPIRLFASGAEAAAHGVADMEAPSERARATIRRLVRKP